MEKDQMKNSTLKKRINKAPGLYLLLISCILLAIGLWYGNYQELGMAPDIGARGLNMLGTLFLLTLIIERAVEAFILTWRGEQKMRLEGNVERLAKQLESDPSNPTSLADQALANEELVSFRGTTQKIAIASTFTIGFILSLAGYNILGTFFEVDERPPVVVNQDLELKLKELKSEIDTTKIKGQEIFIRSKIATNKDTFLKIPFTLDSILNGLAQVDTSLQKLREKNPIVTSLKIQDYLYYYVGILITALMIAGGSEAIHKIFTTYDAFMNTTKETIEEQKK